MTEWNEFVRTLFFKVDALSEVDFDLSCVLVQTSDNLREFEVCKCWADTDRDWLELS